MSSEESEWSLEDGSDESSFRCLQQLFFLSRFFFFDDESDDDGSGLGSPPVHAFPHFFELSVDFVSGFSCNVVTKSVCRVCGIFSLSRSKTSLVSGS